MDRKIKIIHVVTLMELGGAQQTALTILRNLDRDRFEPHLLCGQGGWLDAAAKESGIPVEFVPGLRREIRPWSDLRALVSLYGSFRRERPDIVHTHSSKAGVLGRLAALLAGVPAVVHTVHGFGFTPAQPAWVRSLFVFLERFLGRRTTALVFVSNANRAEALSRGIGRASQMHVIRAAVPLSAYFNLTHSRSNPPGIALAPSDKLVTTIGPFKPQKNLSDFVRAAALVAKQRPEVRFLIIGDGQGRASLEQEIKNHKLEKTVLLAGWRRDIPAILDRTDIFCMTSLWEGLPMALLEAMAAGLPSVVNDVDGCRDVIVDGQTGFLTPPGHPEITALRLIQLIDDSALSHQMGKRARESLGTEFDQATMIRDHERLYVSLKMR